MTYKILQYDPYLAPFEGDIRYRMAYYAKRKAKLLNKGSSGHVHSLYMRGSARVIWDRGQ